MKTTILIEQVSAINQRYLKSNKIKPNLEVNKEEKLSSCRDNSLMCCDTPLIL